ncbi:aminopeptidase Q [Drosophila biarmipes]|uniref:aminopeptidase Q n=1 Tax=Drosophila biarmipes TaxID=125945 RepID=UPI0007E790B9|nr:aminopeptidase Q [Drosophila biarmipes]
MLISSSSINEVGQQNVAVYRLLLLFVLCQLACCAMVPGLYDEPRLPATITPFHYDIRLITHLENPANHRYNGFVNISLHAQKTTNQVVLHVAGVSVKANKITLYGETSGFRLTTVKFNKKRDYMVVTFNQPLWLGKSYVLSIEFGRSMTNKLEDGYFLRHYVNAKTKEKIWYSISHFNRNLIRNTLPSFDEPRLRATFNVTMGHHKRFQSYSNMNVRAVLPNHDIPDYVWSVHEVTPLMPTYLLAFSVNNFTCRFTQAASANPVRFRTCSQSDNVRETSFAAEKAPQLLEFMDSVLKVSLPLEKIDQLVVDDFPTEDHFTKDLGLVVYHGQHILQREDGPMTRSKRQALQRIAQGMAHMWFGNLLGIDWWSDLWLMEGLTGYFEILAMDHVEPGRGRRLQLRNRETSFMYESEVGGMSLLSFWTPASPETEKHLYQKASTLIAMVNGFLGNATFYDGLQRHMWQNYFASSTPDLFWCSLQLASERESLQTKNWDVKSVMDTWTRKSGYPLVTVTRNGNNVVLTQRPALNRSKTDLWWIPLTYTIEGETFPEDLKPRAWLSPSQSPYQLEELVPHSQWILLNLRAVGYYRVNYDEHTWQLLANTLIDDFRSIHVLNRAQIVSDVIFLWKEELISWTTAFNVLRYIVDEDEYEPLMALVVGVTNGLWGISPESALSIAKWLGIAGRWYAEFISYTFDKFVVKNPNLNSLDYPD